MTPTVTTGGGFWSSDVEDADAAGPPPSQEGSEATTPEAPPTDADTEPRGVILRRTPFDWSLLLWMVSALVGVAIAYDPASAWVKFGYICGGVALYYFVSMAPSKFAGRGDDDLWLRVIVAVAPASIATWFLLTNDWTQPAEKVAWLEPLRQWLAERQPRLPWPRMQPQVVGGLLAMWLPLQVAALAPRQDPRGLRRLAAFLGPHKVPVLGLSCLALLSSSLRGAWLALAAAVCLLLSWRLGRRLSGNRGWLVPAAALVVGVATVTVLSITTSWGASLLALRPDRLMVWRNSWDLAWDYFFTGLGLGGFTMAYSSYVLLVHVPHTTHAHSLFLDIWLEQGIIGLMAVAWVLIVALRTAARSVDGAAEPAVRPARWRTAGLTSLLVLVLHGLVDDVYYGYGGSGALLLFVPVAFLARHDEQPPADPGQPRHHARRTAGIVGLIATLTALSLPSTRALCRANVGTVLQTRAELSVYQWPEWPVQDALRRSNTMGLAAAVDHYQAALGIDPGNVVANRRLGQIALSLGKYDEARTRLEAAYGSAPQQLATRQMYGESLALTGDIARAAALWRTLPLEQDQLVLREWWYTNANDKERAARISEAVRLAKKH